jgi:tetratricopeptide (TPR) repeat protein
VGQHQRCRLLAFLAAGCVLVSSPASAFQAPPAPTVQDKLNRVGSDLYSATPHPAEAVQELKAILASEPSLAEGHLLLGLAYRMQGSPDLLGEAVAELRQAIALKPTLMLARLALARVYLDMARATRAREELEAALEQAPGHPQVLCLLGEAERRLGHADRSVELNRQALQADAALPQARYYLGLALLDLQQHAEAIREMQLAVQSGANPAEAYAGLGAAYLEAGRVNEALTALGESARLDPSRPDTHIQLSRAYRSKGRLADAAKELKLATSSGRGGLNALYQDVQISFSMEEGLLRLQQGRLEAAAESFQKVLEIDSSYEPARRQLADIRRRLRDKPAKKSPGAET